MPILTDNIKHSTVLTKIVQDKAIWLEKQKHRLPLTQFESHINTQTRDFYQALKQPRPVFILECKKASPSKGLIRADFDVEQIGTAYKPYADVISVLTDDPYFQGDFSYLKIMHDTVPQPVLCKDFIIDPYQIYLARYYQADAILLMLSVLDDEQYQILSQLAHQLNMGVLTEASTEEEVTRAINLKAKVIGINNRNLRNLSVDLNRVKQLSTAIPKETTIISESGIYTHKQVQELSPFANGFLIGSALMEEEDLSNAVRKVIFGENKVCGLTNPQDAQAVYQAGSFYGGLIFVKTSPRVVTVDQAREIIQSVPLNWVGVFRDEAIPTIADIAKELKLTAVQLHGQEDGHYIELLAKSLPKHCQIWQAVTIKDHVPACDNPLVKRYIFDNGAGGTGQRFNWQLLKHSPLNSVLLAGGINPENVQQALSYGCLGVDINSGVESKPGIKDHQLLTQIFTQLRQYQARSTA
ncbi:bifunctional indole-3-glycerol-phosphate synthase TrpC/phosphoribosylanthranilate isomerase TrpF [Zophobihabitans entericus]|uniref:Multifunctional fusion protein n=1 Tax=Zophobihabitans entericus TaxID=1635327 RepID=A0A6G9I7S7_9GAMM|nr:bifunctional indole-3-glycerol-phosphate synthase TrpC/phosphoribosylanthranilate isomerase TrpF [Zophobihabitans entericus]QIQ20263.1 bifunctional indole-3-glycerol-phosphate synthase TrpC/phosphoribosylanthranilate isomerase TrpF [Zophobihabitans entericus]